MSKVLSGFVLAIGLMAGAADAADLQVAAQFFASSTPVTVEAAQGKPPAAPVKAADGRLLGYAFSTLDVSGSVGYAGRPLDIVAAITTDGIVTGATIVAHEEPILVIGIPKDALAAYVANFKGFDIRPGASLKPSDDLSRGPHAVAGATITSTVIRDAILRSARAVLRSRVAVTDTAPRLDRETLRRLSWQGLLAEGAVQRRLISRGEAAKRLGTQDGEPDKPFIDLWLALATPPPIGESLLGQRGYEAEMGKVGTEDDLVLIGASGLYSFKGTAWRQSGTFERIELVQGSRTIALKAADHTAIEALHAAGAPELREIAVFRIRHASGFDPTKPFRLDLDLGAPSSAAGPAVVGIDYRIPDRYLIAPPPPSTPSTPAASAAAAQAQSPVWQDIWWSRRYEIGVLGAMLAVLAAILVLQDTVTAHGQFYYRLRTGYMLLTLVFLGLIANAQLSVVNVLTFIHALLSGFRWELFLLDPLVFLLWSFVAVSMLFWGRGVFCGWLCPFGTLQELSNHLARRIGIKQIEVPFGLHERLWMIKYVGFVAILAISLRSILAAFTVAEIEPFKTTITMKLMREWPFVLYALTLLGAGLFIERFYCRYLCPLGAALAIPARMRMFEWLKRYRECGAECHVCARRCTVQAIHPLGQINPNECIYCLKCQANYFDSETCLHLKKRAQRRTPLPPPTSAPPARSS
ncbi:nitrous oxide expression regulator, NosR [Bradyrhizobium oligotrophicum S58]|uniref:Nitrous oxide expression regulator, NosR n=1 Tax=Bradyrhizobium oligotrophicum S58 TaxID=1245469 RepID=M4ZGA7_9BRAD|nr:NosR/NirI family protein [Bradyrhizobium oligotrophicum]BAM92789.1 nitrous oxide expression regulator, NosR [Bradyrhizobium oligotrophicum S58]